MKNIIEQTIIKNLPEKKEGDAYSKRLEQQVMWTDIGFNQALSQINTSLIADEVLKVVVDKIKEEVEKYEPAYESEDMAIVEFGKQLLNNLNK